MYNWKLVPTLFKPFTVNDAHVYHCNLKIKRKYYY